jgi:hypothetical protein
VMGCFLEKLMGSPEGKPLLRVEAFFSRWHPAAGLGARRGSPQPPGGAARWAGTHHSFDAGLVDTDLNVWLAPGEFQSRF